MSRFAVLNTTLRERQKLSIGVNIVGFPTAGMSAFLEVSDVTGAVIWKLSTLPADGGTLTLDNNTLSGVILPSKASGAGGAGLWGDIPVGRQNYLLDFLTADGDSEFSVQGRLEFVRKFGQVGSPVSLSDITLSFDANNLNLTFSVLDDARLVAIEDDIAALKNISFENLIHAESFVNQDFVTLDTPIQISFGPSQDDAEINLTAAGALTIKKSRLIYGEVFLQPDRLTGAKATLTFIRALKNGAQFGNPVHIERTQESGDILYVPIRASTTAGDVFTMESYQASGAGLILSGGFRSRPSTVVGWTDSPATGFNIRYNVNNSG